MTSAPATKSTPAALLLHVKPLNPVCDATRGSFSVVYLHAYNRIYLHSACNTQEMRASCVKAMQNAGSYPEAINIKHSQPKKQAPRPIRTPFLPHVVQPCFCGMSNYCIIGKDCQTHYDNHLDGFISLVTLCAESEVG